MLHSILAILAHYGYGALFLVAVAEGPIVTVIAGFLASQGVLDTALVFAVAVTADLTGDLLLYAIGRSGGTTLRAWRHEPSNRDRVAIMRRRFRAQPGKALLFGKLTHGAGFLFLLAAGAERIQPTTFLWYNLLGTLPKTAAFLALGYFAGAAYNRINSDLAAASLAVFVLICAGAFLLARRSPVSARSEA